ncbi:MAG: hypothetical protein ACM3YO_02585, partial [Bacteroidota bacterium]
LRSGAGSDAQVARPDHELDLIFCLFSVYPQRQTGRGFGPAFFLTPSCLDAIINLLQKKSELASEACD